MAEKVILEVNESKMLLANHKDTLSKLRMMWVGCIQNFPVIIYHNHFHFFKQS